MSRTATLSESQSLYELAWSYAPSGMFAFDAETGIIVDANPAAQAMMGYRREELVGLHQSQLHPENEREAARAEFRKAAEQPSEHPGFHLLRKDGVHVPVLGWSSKTVQMAGQAVVIVVCRHLRRAV